MTASRSPSSLLVGDASDVVEVGEVTELAGGPGDDGMLEPLGAGA